MPRSSKRRTRRNRSMRKRGGANGDNGGNGGNGGNNQGQAWRSNSGNYASNVPRPGANNLMTFPKPVHNASLNGVFAPPEKMFKRQNAQRNLRQGESNALWKPALNSRNTTKKAWWNFSDYLPRF